MPVFRLPVYTNLLINYILEALNVLKLQTLCVNISHVPKVPKKTCNLKMSRNKLSRKNLVNKNIQVTKKCMQSKICKNWTREIIMDKGICKKRSARKSRIQFFLVLDLHSCTFQSVHETVCRVLQIFWLP